MGIGDFADGDADVSGNRYKKYAEHERQEDLEKIVEDAQDRFPGGVEIDFIEVSPEMTKKHGYCYYKPDAVYVRIAEKVVEEYPWYYVENVVLHELVHAWMDNNGYGEFSDHSGIFEWVCGQVGADITKIAPHTREYEIIREFKGV